MTPIPPGFLQAVLDAPDDDAPRAALADYLTEQGDPRGEFIAVQLKLARAKSLVHVREGQVFCHSELGRFAGPALIDETGRDLMPLASREREFLLLKRGLIGFQLPGMTVDCARDDERGTIRYYFYRSRKGRSYRGYCGFSCTFCRGFVERIVCAAADAVAHLDAITAVQPVREVELETWPEVLYDRYVPGPAGPAPCLADSDIPLVYPNWRPSIAAYDQWWADLMMGTLTARWRRVTFKLPNMVPGTVAPHPAVPAIIRS